MTAIQAIEVEIAMRRKKVEMLELQIEQLQATLAMLEDADRSVSSVTASAPVQPETERKPAWFRTAEILFADGQVHTTTELEAAVKPFEIDRKAVGVWLSRRCKRGILRRVGRGKYQREGNGEQTGS